MLNEWMKKNSKERLKYLERVRQIYKVIRDGNNERKHTILHIITMQSIFIFIIDNF